MGCVQARVSEWSLSTLPSPIPELQHAPLPLKVLWAKEHAPTPPSSIVFYLDPHLGPLRNWEHVIYNNIIHPHGGLIHLKTNPRDKTKCSRFVRNVMYSNFERGNNSQLWSIASWTFQSSCKFPLALTRPFDFCANFRPHTHDLRPYVDSHPHLQNIRFPCEVSLTLWKPFGSHVNFCPLLETFNSCDLIISWFGISSLGKWFWKV